MQVAGEEKLMGRKQLELVGAPESITREMVDDARENDYLLVTRVYAPNTKSLIKVVQLVLERFLDAGFTEHDVNWIMVCAVPKDLSDYEFLEIVKEQTGLE